MKPESFAFCEQLENRRFLSATLVDGVLKVVGTRGDDEINVALVNGKPSRMGVNLNGSVSTFAAANVRRVVIHGRAGDDLLSGGFSNEVMPLGVFITGGPGDDEIYGTHNNDYISGGDDNDEIYADDGDDVIVGGVGDDEIYAGAGDDQMFGGDGADRLYGDDGNDLFAGGDGTDRFWGGKGNDRVLIPLSGPSSAGFAVDQPKELNDLWLLY